MGIFTVHFKKPSNFFLFHILKNRSLTQEIKPCPVNYFPYLESKMPSSVTPSAWKYSCFKLNCHARKKYSNFKDYRYQGQRFQKLLPEPLPFPFPIPFKSLMVHNISKIVPFFCPLPNLLLKIYYFLNLDSISHKREKTILSLSFWYVGFCISPINYNLRIYSYICICN